MSTALAESEVDERSDLGLLASPLVTRQLRKPDPSRNVCLQVQTVHLTGRAHTHFFL